MPDPSFEGVDKGRMHAGFQHRPRNMSLEFRRDLALKE